MSEYRESAWNIKTYTYFFNSSSAALQARTGQPEFSAVYCGVLKRQTAAFSGQHLRQWRITITTMTGIGLTGASVEEEGKKPRVRGSRERASRRVWPMAGGVVWGVRGDRAGVGRAALPLWWMEGRAWNSTRMGCAADGRVSGLSPCERCVTNSRPVIVSYVIINRTVVIVSARRCWQGGRAPTMHLGLGLDLFCLTSSVIYSQLVFGSKLTHLKDSSEEMNLISFTPSPDVSDGIVCILPLTHMCGIDQLFSLETESKPVTKLISL